MRNSLSPSRTPELLKTDNPEIHFPNYIAPVNNGLEYIDTGTGAPCLFLHGALSNYNTWRKIIPLLCKDIRCIAVNLPLGAHNIPLNKDTDLSPAGISELINELLIYLKLDSVTIFANDTGGAYAQVFTSKYPEKVNKLILSNCEGLDIFPPSKFAYLKFAVKIPGFNYLMSRLFTIKPLLKTDMMLGLLSLNLTKEELYHLYVYHFIHHKLIRDDFGKMARTWSPKYTMDAASKLKDFDKPVLILWGDKDFKLFPLKLGYKLKNVFPNAKLVEIKNARTYIQEDEPEQTVREIVKFIL